MRNRKREEIKTRVLLLLIILSLVQIGIHWSKQNQGLPFPFITKIFSETGKSATKLETDVFKERFFKPQNIIVSVSTTHFRLYESDSEYKKVWEDVRDNYLPAIIRQKPVKVLPKDQWAEITSGRCTKIDFEINWPSEIVYLLEETKPVESGSFSGIKSIAIVPQQDVNETINTLYIYDEAQVFQYSVAIRGNYLPKSFYSSIDRISIDKPGLRLLSTVSSFTSEQDIYVSLDTEKGRRYSSVNVEIPESITLSRENIENDIIQEKILLNQKESFSANYLDGTSSAMFTDTENLYKLFDDGTLEYKYIPSSSSSAGSIAKAFEHAATFIELRRELVGDADIILNSIKSTGSYYEMEFDYRVAGIQVNFAPNREERIIPSIVIKSNENRIIECKWVIRSFSLAKNSKIYNVDFADLLNKQIVTDYPEILRSQDISFIRFEPGYVFTLENSQAGNQNQLVEPEWIISTNSQDYLVPLLEKGW